MNSSRPDQKHKQGFSTAAVPPQGGILTGYGSSANRAILPYWYSAVSSIYYIHTAAASEGDVAASFAQPGSAPLQLV